MLSGYPASSCFGAAVVLFAQSSCIAHVALWRCLWFGLNFVFPTCQVRVVRFYVSLLVLLIVLLVLLLSRPCDCSVACQTSTAIL